MTSLDRSLALFPLLALAVACGSSTTSSTSPSDSGTTRHDAGSTHHDAGSVHKDSGLSKGDAGADVGTGLTAVYTTACTPPFDAGAMKSLTETVATVPLMCLVSPLTSGVTVVDSASAVAALFAEDASAECALPSIVSGVDFTTDSIAVFPGSAAGASGLGIYQAGAQIVFVTTAAGANAAVGLVYLVVLPAAQATSTDVVHCTTNCSGPGCPA